MSRGSRVGLIGLSRNGMSGHKAHYPLFPTPPGSSAAGAVASGVAPPIMNALFAIFHALPLIPYSTVPQFKASSQLIASSQFRGDHTPTSALRGPSRGAGHPWPAGSGSFPSFLLPH
jgi:hypothetical protein